MPIIALTPGCPAGIGPELFPLALSKADIAPDTSFIWCGSIALFEKHAARWVIPVSRIGSNFSITGKQGRVQITALLDDEKDPALQVLPGQANQAALLSQKNALLTAIHLAQKNEIHAIVTGPARKSALVDIEGKSFPGQTELFHHYLHTDENLPLMCFAGYDFLLGLATIHVPIKEVSNRITKELLHNCILRLHKGALAFFQLPSSDIRISVLGLNPHAGENRLIGDEEVTIIEPAIKELKKSNLQIKGPLAADGFFARALHSAKDELPHAVLAMYHDQGLAPYKLLGEDKITNMTLGLTIPRLSPAHGTADDIAGKYIANPASLIQAIELAKKSALFFYSGS